MFGGEERHKEVVAIQETGTFIANEDLNAASIRPPANFNRACLPQPRIKGCIRGVANQVDENLLELIGVGIDLDQRTLQHPYRQTPFESPHPMPHSPTLHTRQRRPSPPHQLPPPLP